VGPQEKSPLRLFLENVATLVKQEVASPEPVFNLGYAMLSLKNSDEQERHNDWDNGIFKRNGCKQGNMLLLAPPQEWTKLIIWRKVIGQEPTGSFTRMQLTLKCSKILVFRGNLDHAGALYNQENFAPFSTWTTSAHHAETKRTQWCSSPTKKVIDSFSHRSRAGS
jgi:hypothetical protein